MRVLPPMPCRFRDDARFVMKREMPSILHPIVDGMSDRDLSIWLENNYDGGYSRFIEVFSAPVKPPANAISPSIRLKAQLRDLVVASPRWTNTCYEVLRVNENTDGTVTAVIRFHDIEERALRHITRGAELRVIQFDSMGLISSVDSYIDPEFVPETHLNSHANLVSPERYAEKFWQWYECYRPGTDRTPLDGAERRETTHQEYTKFISAMTTEAESSSMYYDLNNEGI